MASRRQESSTQCRDGPLGALTWLVQPSPDPSTSAPCPATLHPAAPPHTDLSLPSSPVPRYVASEPHLCCLDSPHTQAGFWHCPL